ncbi:uncharacterized protein LOC129258535 [Lytechinus pictus]|uniref:uncharacterized protein LOC129258535 n=1 Tax=Lytechinus pictus TaxID=7653 RepID=UPI0030B9D681
MSHFSDDPCQGCLQDKEQKTYHMVMRLCDDCALQKKHFIEKLALEKKVVFSCSRHPALKALAFCTRHDETICLECLPAHIGPCCSMMDLNAKVVDRRSQLSGLVERCKIKADEFKQFNIHVDTRTHQIDTHFAEIEDEIRQKTSQEKREVEENRDLRAECINKNAEEKLERIRQERYEDLTRNQREAEKRLDAIKKKQKGLLERVDQIKAMFTKKISKMKSYLQQTLETVEKAESYDDDEMLQPDFQKTVVSLTSVLNKQVDASDVDKLVEAAESVEGFDGDKRIDVPLERWDEQDGLTWKTGLGKGSYMMGAINMDEVLLKMMDGGSVHAMNVYSGDTRVVVSGKTPYDIYSCAALQDGRIVCGTRFGEIVVYDRDWKPLRVMHLDYSGKSVKLRPVSICIDRAGLILASNGESTVHVFNPDEGDFVRSIDTNVRSICEIHLLSSDDIALRIRSLDEECTDVRILDNMGCLRSTHHLHNKNLIDMAADMSRGHIFMMLLDHDDDCEEFDMAVLSSSGVADIDVELPFDSRTLAEMCFMPEKSDLVVHYEETTGIFRKTDRGLEEIISNID